MVAEVASHAELLSLNLVSWPDSLIGFVRSPQNDKYYGFGFGENGDVMRARLSDDGLKIEEGIRAQMEIPAMSEFPIRHRKEVKSKDASWQQVHLTSLELSGG